MLNRDACYELDHDRAAGEVIDGEAIVINLGTGAYYSLNESGSRIWQFIEQRQPAGVMLDWILSAYEVGPEDAAADLDAILGQLSAEGLVRVASAGSTVPAPAGSARKPYAAPRLQAYRDMQDLLALDPPAPGLSGLSWPGTGTGRADTKPRS